MSSVASRRLAERDCIKLEGSVLPAFAGMTTDGMRLPTRLIQFRPKVLFCGGPPQDGKVCTVEECLWRGDV